MRVAFAGIGFIAGLILAQCAASQEPRVSVDSILAAARQLTERDPAVRTLDVRARYMFPGGPVRFQFKYDSHQSSSLFVAMENEKATIFAGGVDRVLRYDAESGGILLEVDAVPSFAVGVENDVIGVKWGSNSGPKPSQDPPMLLVDFPALLRYPSNAPSLDKVADGEYRLRFVGTGGGTMSVTVVPDASFPFTRLLIESRGQRYLELDIRMNWSSLEAESLPESARLRGAIAVRELKVSPKDGPAIMRMIATQMLPVAASDSEGSADIRKAAEFFSGKKYDWLSIQDRLKHDLPVLRTLLPLPEAPVVR